MPSISCTPSIYQIRHIESGKVYVGSAVNPRQRWGSHFSELKHRIHHSPLLQRAWDKYGESAFVFEVIEPVLFVEDLIEREQHWIDTLHACDPLYGYNTALIAGSSLGVKYTDEQLARAVVRRADPAYRKGLSDRAKARCADPDVRKGISDRAKKRTADPEVRQEMSARSKAYYADPDARQRSSERTKAMYADPAARKRSSDRAKARLADPVARKELSDRAKARFADPAARQKASEQATARFADPSARERLSALAKARWANPEYRARQKMLRDERKKKH